MTPKRLIPAVAALPWLLAGPAAAFEISAARYLCDRGVEVPTVYVNAPDAGAVVLVVEGRQITLHSEAAASGARYGFPSGGSSYVWLTQGAEAVLFWKDGAAGTETEVLGHCRMAD